jgi:WD40 repeat protein
MMFTAVDLPHLRALGEGGQAWLTELAWSADGRALAAAHAQGVTLLQVHADHSLTPVQTLPHPAPCKSVALHPSAPIIATACADTAVRLWRGAHTPQLLHAHQDAALSVAFSPCGRWLLSGGADGRVCWWDVDSGALHHSIIAHNGEVAAVCFGADATQAASAGRDGHLVLYHEQRISARHTHDTWLRHMCYDDGYDDGRYAIACKDGRICIYAADGTLAAQFAAHDGGVDAVLLRGALCVSGGRDHAVRLWDVRDEARELRTLTTHQKPVLALAAHPSRAWLASGGGDNRIVLWGVDQGAQG